MFSWREETSLPTTVDAKAVWKLWSHVESWPTWDEELEWAKLKGEFIAGAEGELKPKEWAPLSFVLIEVTPYKSFTTLTKLPLTKVIFTHTLENGVLTHGAHASGFLAPLLRFTLKRKLKNCFPCAIKKLIAQAQ